METVDEWFESGDLCWTEMDTNIQQMLQERRRLVGTAAKACQSHNILLFTQGQQVSGLFTTT